MRRSTAEVLLAALSQLASQPLFMLAFACSECRLVMRWTHVCGADTMHVFAAFIATALLQTGLHVSMEST
jgi:hypothetical protein